MPTSFRQIFITFSIISLFAFAAISFNVAFQTENNSSSSILENQLINSTFTQLNTLSSSSSNASESQFAGANSSKTNFSAT